jgi:class 3 adenylate cyclase/tetratricopeptide (TPR) repeat protein
MLDGSGVAPDEARLQGAALFADISGYTRLAETFLARADEGLGELSATLNAVFGRYVAIVHEHGGEIVHFAGDSLLAYWSGSAGEVAGCVRNARACASELLRASRHTNAMDVTPGLHCGVGAGPMWAARVGGEDGCWHLLFGGPAVREATSAGAIAKRGELQTGATAAAYVAPAAGTEGMSAEAHRGGHAEVRDDAATPLSYPPPPSSIVPRVIIERGVSEVGELRQVTAVFASFEGFDEDQPGALERMHRLACEVHRTIAPFAGSPGRWVIDDKGLVFFVVFGVPYNTHADDPLRAVQAALALHEVAWPAGVRCGIGIASGRAYCGTLGGASRREYVTVGRSMIVAARLMSAGGDPLYAGRPPADTDVGPIRFDAAPPVHAKGFADPIPAYSVRRRSTSASSAAPMVGRAGEQAALDEMLSRAIAGESVVALIQAEAGMGKSCLIAALVNGARAYPRVVTLVGQSDSVEYAPTFLPWRRIFRGLLGATVADDPEQVREALARWLSAHPDLEPFGPLLNAVFRIALPDTDATRHLLGPARAEAMMRVMVDFLASTAPGPRLIVLEDCHWMDADSWRLARAVARLPGTLTVLTMRPASLPTDAAWVREHADLREIALQPLGVEEIEQVVRRQLRATSVSGNLVAEVQRRAAGHPLMAIEYALLLLESLRVAEHDGHYALRGGSQWSRDDGPPASMQSLLASRIDHLELPEQLMLKTASVIGPSFSSDALRRIAADSFDATALRRLVERQLIEPQPETGTFAFRHSLVREVAYGLMLITHRRALHVALARMLEEEGPQSDRAILAHHCYHACEYERTVEHADAAATRALRMGAYREAVHFLDLCAQLGPSFAAWSDVKTTTRWRRELADAYHGLGDLVARRQHAQGALLAAGRDADPSKAAKAVAVASRLTRQIASAARGARPVARPDPSAASPDESFARDLARAYGHMVELAYFDNDALGMVWGALNAIEVAERGPPSPDLALAYAQLGGAMGLAGAHPLARRFVQSAIRAAKDADAVHAESYAHMCNALYQVGLGNWSQARASVERCQELRVRTRDHVTWGYAEVVRFWTHYYRDERAEAHDSARRLRAESDRTHHAQHAAWGLRCEALLEARRDAHAEAITLLEEARSLLSDTKDVNELIMIHGALGLARLRLGHRNAAIESATLVLQIGGEGRRPTNHATLTGMVASVEVMFELWQREPHAPTWQKLARRGVESLGRYRRVFPIAEPSFRLLRGRLRSAMGRSRSAREDLVRGAASARTLGMVVEEQRLQQTLWGTSSFASDQVPREDG